MKNQPLPKLTTKQQAQFWLQVNRNNLDKCWEWQGYIEKHSYGTYNKILAHRLAYFLWYSKDPKEFCVCHYCDNPKCCNPYHLWLGTFDENMQDRDKKSRQTKGEDCHMAILTENDVREILTIGHSQILRKTAKQYNVSSATICNILKGRVWKHVYQEVLNGR